VAYSPVPAEEEKVFYDRIIIIIITA